MYNQTYMLSFYKKSPDLWEDIVRKELSAGAGFKPARKYFETSPGPPYSEPPVEAITGYKEGGNWKNFPVGFEQFFRLKIEEGVDVSFNEVEPDCWLVLYQLLYGGPDQLHRVKHSPQKLDQLQMLAGLVELPESSVEGQISKFLDLLKTGKVQDWSVRFYNLGSRKVKTESLYLSR
jgi:hypothetical protein